MNNNWINTILGPFLMPDDEPHDTENILEKERPIQISDGIWLKDPSEETLLSWALNNGKWEPFGFWKTLWRRLTKQEHRGTFIPAKAIKGGILRRRPTVYFDGVPWTSFTGVGFNEEDPDINIIDQIRKDYPEDELTD